MHRDNEVINRLNKLPPVANIICNSVLLIFALIIIMPLILVVVVSFTDPKSIGEIGYSYFPAKLSLTGYEYLFKTGDQVLTSYRITIIATVLGTLASLFVTAMFSFVLAQRNFVFNRLFIWIMFFTMLFSGGLVPYYILCTLYLHINDTIWIYILPSLVSGFNVIILRTFMRTTIPEALFDSARIDGAGYFKIFWTIAIPLSKAGLATIALFNVVTRWNDWFTALLFIDKPDLVPLQTMLMRIQSKIDFIKNNSRAANTPDGLILMRNLPGDNLRMACTLLVILPLTMTYPFFQRFFISGLTLGSIKE